MATMQQLSAGTLSIAICPTHTHLRRILMSVSCPRERRRLPPVGEVEDGEEDILTPSLHQGRIERVNVLVQFSQKLPLVIYGITICSERLDPSPSKLAESGNVYCVIGYCERLTFQFQPSAR